MKYAPDDKVLNEWKWAILYSVYDETQGIIILGSNPCVCYFGLKKKKSPYWYAKDNIEIWEGKDKKKKNCLNFIILQLTIHEIIRLQGWPALKWEFFNWKKKTKNK